jgi:uncharacterized protein YciI
VTRGPYTDGSGALILVEGSDVASVRELFAQDPFAVENLIEESSITEWKPVMGAFA